MGVSVVVISPGKTKVKVLKKEVAALASAAAPKISRRAKKKAKKTSGFKSLVSSAVGLAADLAPALLPILLGTPGHAATKAAYAANPAAFGAVPLASSSTGGLSQLTGLRDFKVTKKDLRGNVSRVCVTTVDVVSTVGTAGNAAGDVVWQAWLSPLDPAFQGTKFAEFGQQYERWRLKKAVFMYAATSSAMNNGAYTMAVFNDPLIDVASMGDLETIRVAGSQQGAETFCVYDHGVAGVPTIGDDFLYTDPDGTDVRLTVGGKVVLVCSAAVAGGYSPGMLYLIAETEYDVPSLGDSAGTGFSGRFKSTTVQGANASISFDPFIDVNAVNKSYLGDGASFNLNASYYVSGTARNNSNCFVGLSAGDWFAQLYLGGTGLSTGVDGCAWYLTDSAVAQGCTMASVPTNYGSSTEMAGCALISVPPGLVPNTNILAPVIGPVTTITYLECFICKVNEDLFTGDTVSLVQKKRDQFFAKTLQGKQLATDRKLATINDALLRLSVPSPSQLKPIAHEFTREPTSTYTSFSSLPMVKASSLASPSLAVKRGN